MGSRVSGPRVYYPFYYPISGTCAASCLHPAKEATRALGYTTRFTTRIRVVHILPGILPDFGYLSSVVAVPCEEAEGNALDHFVQVHQRLCLDLVFAFGVWHSWRFLPPDPAGSGRRSYSPVLARPRSLWLVAQPSKSAAHRDKNREWNVSK